MAGLQDLLLAGIGAMSITGEKAKETVDILVKQGQITLEQGKQINEELQHKAAEGAKDAAADATTAAKDATDKATAVAKDVAEKAEAAAQDAVAKTAAFVSPIEELGIEVRMKAMTPEARAAFVAKIQEIAAKVDAEEAEAEVEVVEEASEEAAEESETAAEEAVEAEAPAEEA